MTHQQPDIDKMFQLLNLTDLSIEEKDNILSALQERMQDLILMTAIKLMDDEQKKEMNEALEDEQNGEERITLLASSIPNLQDHIDLAIQNEILSLRAMLK